MYQQDSATATAATGGSYSEARVEFPREVRMRARGAAADMLASGDTWVKGLGSRIQRIVAADDRNAAAAVRTYLSPADLVHLQASIKYVLWLRTSWSLCEGKEWVTDGLTKRYVNLLRDQEIVLELLHEAV